MPSTPPPIVLQHGFLGVGDFTVGPFCGLGPLRLSYFHRIDRAIADRGHPLIVPRVSPAAGIHTRAGQLKRAILDGLDRLGKPKDRVVIVAHSMGGLDARHMVSKLGMADRVSALVTVATPHRGSPFADYVLRHLGERFGGLRLCRAIGLDVQAISDLACDGARRFDDDTPDADGVAYYSVSTARPLGLTAAILMPSHRVIAAAEGENDGLVSVKSASARGTHLGTWPCDHLHSINKRLGVQRALRRDRTGDIAPYYLAVLDRLAADGLIPARA